MSTDLVEPAGFPNCPQCALAESGSASACWTCARSTLPSLGPDPCPICSQRQVVGIPCHNRLCNMAGRSIDRIEAIAAYSGDLRTNINRYKHENKIGWAPIFGRLLLGYLRANHTPDDFDIIVANPTHRSREPRHTERVTAKAMRADELDEWPWDRARPRSLRKSTPTSASGTSGATWDSKVAAAQEVYDALILPDAEIFADARVLVYDDICTTGMQLDAVARRLKDAGALSVGAVVLARTPW